MPAPLDLLLDEVRRCRLCEATLPLGPRPVLAASTTSRILIAGQAPGSKVHNSGVAWNDPSGDTLRQWLGVDRETFYRTSIFALVPMGFCYPGRGASGDLPPRPECAPRWRGEILPLLTGLRLTLSIGEYSHRAHLGAASRGSVTANVRAFRDFGPSLIPLPHPSPRNRLWLRKNPFFEEELLPVLRARVAEILRGGEGAG